MAHTIQDGLGRLRLTDNEQRIVQLHPKTEGWVDELFIDTTGAPGHKPMRYCSACIHRNSCRRNRNMCLRSGTLKLYSASPFEDVRRWRRGTARHDDSSERLRLFDVPDHQIENLKPKPWIVKKNLHIHSPTDGIVIRYRGSRRTVSSRRQTELYAIADLTEGLGLRRCLRRRTAMGPQIGDRGHDERHGGCRANAYFRGQAELHLPLCGKPDTDGQSAYGGRQPRSAYSNRICSRTSRSTPAPVSDAIAVPSEAIVRSGVREQVFILQRARRKIRASRCHRSASAAKAGREITAGR